MKLLTYDEVDHDQALIVHLSGFGWPLTEERARAMARYDKRMWKPFGLYAVIGDKVVGQIIPFKIPMRSREGVEHQLGVAEVVTAPDETRKGIAKELMARMEGMAAEQSIRTSWLMTGEHLVAVNLYKKLGYFNVSTFPRGFKRVPKRVARPSGIKIRPYRREDRNKVAAIYRKHTEHSLGFTERQKDFLELGVRTHQLGKEALKVATRAGKVVGYAVTSTREGLAFLTEVVAPDETDFAAMVSAFEHQYRGSLVIASSLIWKKQRDRFSNLGYQIRSVHWYRLMAKPLDSSMSKHDLEHLYGVDDGSFAFMALDGF